MHEQSTAYPIVVMMSTQLIFAFSALLLSTTEGELIIPLIESLSKYYDTKCVEILFNGNKHPLHDNDLLFIMKKVAPSRLTTMYNLDEYGNVKITESGMSRCNRPLRVAYGKNINRLLYEKMSRWIPQEILRPVSLVMMQGSTIEYFFENVSLPLHLLTLAAVVQTQQLIDLHAVFKVDVELPLRVKKVGNWTPEMGVFIDKAVLDLEGSNFEGKLFRTASIETRPFVSFRSTPGKKYPTNKWHGQYRRVWRILQEKFNITSVQHGFTEYGEEKPDKNWTGMIGALLTREVDAIVSDLTLTPDRCSLMDFVNVFPFSTSRLYFKEIGSQLAWDVTLKPYACEIWWSLLAIWLIFISCLCFTKYMYLKHGITPEQPVAYSDLVFETLRTIMVQGFNPPTKTFTMRLLMSIAHISTIILLTAYSVFLILFLSRESPMLPFKTLQGLLDDGSYKILLQPQGTYKDYFANSTDEKKRQVYARLSEPFQQKYYENLSSAGLEAVCGPRKVGLLESEQLIHFSRLRAHGCHILPLLDVQLKTPHGMAFRKGSSFPHMARNFVTKMRETGLIHRSLRQMSSIVINLDDTVKPIGLEQVLIIFLMLLSGIFNSLLILAIEIILHSSARRKLAARRQLAASV